MLCFLLCSCNDMGHGVWCISLLLHSGSGSPAEEESAAEEEEVEEGGEVREDKDVTIEEDLEARLPLLARGRGRSLRAAARTSRLAFPSPQALPVFRRGEGGPASVEGGPAAGEAAVRPVVVDASSAAVAGAGPAPAALAIPPSKLLPKAALLRLRPDRPRGPYLEEAVRPYARNAAVSSKAEGATICGEVERLCGDEEGWGADPFRMMTDMAWSEKVGVPRMSINPTRRMLAAALVQSDRMDRDTKDAQRSSS